MGGIGLGFFYCGIPATQVMQDYFLWERLLNDRVVDGIIELGTAYGGFSLFLLHQAVAREIEFVTFDNINHATADIDELFGRPSSRRPTSHHLLGKHFQQVDILRDKVPVVQAIKYLKRPVLFCDNGSKKEEVKMYGRYLPRHSILVVHDWLTEIGPEDIPSDFTEIYGDFCDEINSWSRMFRKC